MDKILKFLNDHPPVRSALRVFGYTFITLFGGAVLGFTQDIIEWASADAGQFPDVSVLGKAFVAALGSAFAGLLSFAYNMLPKTTTAQYPEEN